MAIPTPLRCGRCGGIVSEVPAAAGSGGYRHLDADADHTPVIGTPTTQESMDRLRARIREEIVEPMVEAMDAALEPDDGDEDDDFDLPVLQVPPPAVPARQPTQDEVCAGAARVARAAHKQGWRVSLSYAKGPLLNLAGTKILSPDCESLVVKGVKAGVGVFDATWLARPELSTPGWKFDSAWCSTSREEGFHHRNTKALTTLIHTEVPDATA